MLVAWLLNVEPVESSALERNMGKTTWAALLLIGVMANAQNRSPLGDFRKQFLNQRVVVNQDFGTIASPFLSDWTFVKEKKGKQGTSYSPDESRRVPVTLVGQAGVIIAVMAPSLFPWEQPLAQTDETYVPHAEAIVKLDSGQLLQAAVFTMTTGTNDSDSFALSSVREKHHQEALTLA